jgi:hypothetical protein
MENDLAQELAKAMLKVVGDDAGKIFTTLEWVVSDSPLFRDFISEGKRQHMVEGKHPASNKPSKPRTRRTKAQIAAAATEDKKDAVPF